MNKHMAEIIKYYTELSLSQKAMVLRNDPKANLNREFMKRKFVVDSETGKVKPFKEN